MTASAAPTSGILPTIGELTRDPWASGLTETFAFGDIADDERFRSAVALKEAWLRLPGAIPRRRDVDPTEFGPRLLPKIVILQVLDDGRDYRWRLFGGLHAEQYGADLTGFRLSQVEAENSSAQSLRPIFDQTHRVVAPVYYHLVYRAQAGMERRASGVMLPLREEGETVEALIGCASWT